MNSTSNMAVLLTFTKHSLVVLLGITTLIAHSVIAEDQSMANSYSHMCMTQAINIPVPGGESDLKDNPKLKDYCACFGEKFSVRAMAAAARMSKGEKNTKSLEESNNETLAMRNSCRQKYDLPQVKNKP